MQPSALSADESVLFVIHQLPLLNTEQFSLKGDRNPLQDTTCANCPRALTRAIRGKPKCGDVGWDDEERALGGRFRDTTTLKQREPATNCTC